MRKLAVVRSERPSSGLFGVCVGQDRASVRYDFVCINCGYGVHVAISRLVMSCPMCQQFEWRVLAPPRADRLRAVPGLRAMPLRGER
jgi:hypothetical protein